MSYEQLFAAAVAEARRKDIPVWDTTPPVPRKCEVNGLRLHYLDWGGGGTPLVLLHGALLTAHAWDFFSMQMRQHFRILAVDMPGHGDSGWASDGDYSRAQLAMYVRELVQQLGLDSLILLGHSLGGSVALLVAAAIADRVRALGLVDTTLVPGPPPNAMAGLINGPDVFPTIEAFAEHAARFNPRRRADRLALSLRWNTRRLADGSWTWKYDSAMPRRRQEQPSAWLLDDFETMWTCLESLSCPVLYVRAGEYSHVTDAAAERAQSLAHVRVVVVPDAAHNVMGDNPHGFARVVSEFLTAADLLRGQG